MLLRQQAGIYYACGTRGVMNERHSAVRPVQPAIDTNDAYQQLVGELYSP